MGCTNLWMIPNHLVAAMTLSRPTHRSSLAPQDFQFSQNGGINGLTNGVIRLSFIPEPPDEIWWNIPPWYPQPSPFLSITFLGPKLHPFEGCRYAEEDRTWRMGVGMTCSGSSTATIGHLISKPWSLCQARFVEHSNRGSFPKIA